MRVVTTDLFSALRASESKKDPAYAGPFLDPTRCGEVGKDGWAGSVRGQWSELS